VRQGGAVWGFVLHPAGEAGSCEIPHTVTLTCRPFHAACVASRYRVASSSRCVTRAPGSSLLQAPTELVRRRTRAKTWRVLFVAPAPEWCRFSLVGGNEQPRRRKRYTVNTYTENLRTLQLRSFLARDYVDAPGAVDAVLSCAERTRVECRAEQTERTATCLRAVIAHATAALAMLQAEREHALDDATWELQNGDHFTALVGAIRAERGSV